MARKHFSERELAILCLSRKSLTVSRSSLCFVTSPAWQSRQHRNRLPPLLRQCWGNLLLPRFRRNNLRHPHPLRNKHLQLRQREACGSVSFLRLWTAPLVLASTITAANSCASCIRTRN